jgi:aspartyl-tRNA(Asn)/glutamyl-tRNA(Gln) amidotransferase subunit C
MSMTREEVLAIASLARLEIEESAVLALAEDLSKILDYVRKLDELDTENVEPTLQVTVSCAPLRKDERREGLEKDIALSEAPRADEVGFLVPGFVDES